MEVMAKVNWLFESDVFDENISRIIDEVKRQGMRADIAHYIPQQSGQSYKDFYEPYSCVVFYGTLNFASQLVRETNWIPGAYNNSPGFDCTSYYPHIGHYLLTEKYAMLPYGDLQRQKVSLYQAYGQSDTIFIRPNSGGKVFTGQTVSYEHFDKDVSRLGFYDVAPSELVVVSPPRNVVDEWRFIVVDKKVIAGSQYRKDNTKNVSPEVSPQARALADEVAAGPYQPARAWSLDICRTIHDNFYLLEIGCVSCAGWYACDPEPIIREISRVAGEEWESLSGTFPESGRQGY
jgi:hypothetical protein